MELHCKGINCGNCEYYMHIGGGVRTCALKIPHIYKDIEYAKRELNKPDYDAQIAIMYLRDTQEVKIANLNDLAWAIYRDGNPHKNDVLGLIEHLENYLDTPIGSNSLTT